MRTKLRTWRVAWAALALVVLPLLAAAKCPASNGASGASGAPSDPPAYRIVDVVDVKGTVAEYPSYVSVAKSLRIDGLPDEDSEDTALRGSDAERPVGDSFTVVAQVLSKVPFSDTQKVGAYKIYSKELDESRYPKHMGYIFDWNLRFTTLKDTSFQRAS